MRSESSSLAPSSCHAICNADLPRCAVQKSFATTATPCAIFSIASTPAIARAAASSIVASFEFAFGGLASTAVTAPGTRTSNPNCSSPATISRDSTFATRCPMSFGFTRKRGSGFSVAPSRSAASCAYIYMSPPERRKTVPFEVVHSSVAIDHRLAAAAMNNSRNPAPSRLIGKYRSRIEELHSTP